MSLPPDRSRVLDAIGMTADEYRSIERGELQLVVAVTENFVGYTIVKARRKRHG